MPNTREDRNSVSMQYHIKATCYLTEDGLWKPTIEEAGIFESTELQYRFLHECTLERAELALPNNDLSDKND